jgi:ATP synthase protein I
MGSDPEDRDDDAAALRARLDRLSGELKGRAAPRPTAQPSGARTSNGKPDGTGSAMSLGLRAGSEFVSAVIVGLGIGWVLDRALGTNPAFLIVFFLIGVAAGIWNVIRLTSPKRPH